MVRASLWLLLILPLRAVPGSQGSDPGDQFDHALQFARKQIAASVGILGDSLGYPRSTGKDGTWECVPPDDWTSGFFPGCLWLLSGRKGGGEFRKAADRWTAGLEEQKNNSGSHDIGFMIYCSFGNGYRLTANPRYREVLLQAARTLATRFNPKVGCIKSWDWNPEWQFPVIIDNMMNLELLFWASKNGGGDSLGKIALRHALTTRANHVRPDGSTYHVVNYDTVTGGVVRKLTHQGSADESVWARGQAWAVYGFTMAYRETGDAQLLETAEKVTRYFVDHLPADGVPFWDFLAPGIPRAERDASAAAIAASAMIELSGLTKNRDAGEYFLGSARKILLALCRPPYLAAGTRSAGILNHAVGNMPGRSEVGVSLIYADYYFLESLLRYSRIHP